MLMMVVLATSCIPQKQLLYMQEQDQHKGYTNPYTKATAVTEAYKIQPKDYLYIRVLTPNEEVAALYNLSGAQGSSNMSTMMQGGNAKFMSYVVNDEGNIDFPYVGDVYVKGLTLAQIKENLNQILKKHIDTFTLQVELTNSQFTILGEVRAPGQYAMSRDQLTLYEALAMAGDATVYGKRKQVKIIRPTENGSQTILVDLTDRNLIDSQQYYILPNDLLYIEPMRIKQFGLGESFSFSLITGVVSLVLLIGSL